MRTIKILTLIVVFASFFAGCEKYPVTYSFTDEDKTKLLPHYVEGKILTFVNELGEKRKFKIEKIQVVINTEHWISGGCGGNCHNYFFCVSKNIYLTDIKTQNKFYLSFARYPLEQNEAERDNYRLQPSSLFGLFASVSWLTYSFIFEFSFDEAVQKQRFSYNEITYHNNMIIIHFNEAGYWDEGGGMLTDAKIIYYDVYQGLIGFDDINNHEWRLENK
jgi:hypothetical protein